MEQQKVDLSNRLCLIIPKEKHNYVANIVNSVIANEDEFEIDDMLVSEYENVCEENFRLAEKLREMSTDLVAENSRLKTELEELRNNNVNSTAQFEQCMKDKNIIASELSKERQEMTDTLEILLELLKSEMSADGFNEVINKLTDEQIARYNLEKFKQERKYKIVTVEVTRTTRQRFKVLLHEDDNDSEAANILSNYEYQSNLNDCIDNNIDEYSDTDYDYSIENVNGDYSLEQAKRLDQESLWFDDDVENEIYNS